MSKNGIDTILVVDAVVSIYSEGLYRSGDFVFLGFFNERLPKALKEISFERKDSRHFKHPKCKHLFIEFQNPPVGIGDDVNILPSKRKVDSVNIKIFSPTDCVRDRLASYIHFQSRETLDQATLVASKHPCDLKKIKKWCETEGGKPQFEEFIKSLNLHIASIMIPQ